VEQWQETHRNHRLLLLPLVEVVDVDVFVAVVEYHPDYQTNGSIQVPFGPWSR